MSLLALFARAVAESADARDLVDAIRFLGPFRRVSGWSRRRDSNEALSAAPPVHPERVSFHVSH